MRQLRRTLYELLRDGFPAYLGEKYAGARTCAVLEHALDVVGKRKSGDFPNLVVVSRGDSVFESFPGNVAKGHERRGFIDIIIAVEAPQDTNETYLASSETAEEYMDDVLIYLDGRAEDIAAAGFANLRFREDYGERSNDKNYGTYLAKVAGVQCIVGIICLTAEFSWSDGDIYKGRNITPRR